MSYGGVEWKERWEESETVGLGEGDARTAQVYSVLFVALDRRYTCLHCVARGAPLGKEKYLASYIFKRGGRPNRYLWFFIV
jgi:hypothetical protein